MNRTIHFNYEKLNKSDKKIYDAMTDYEKEKYESTWIQIQLLKDKQNQQKNASKERAAKEKKTLAEKKRKDRNHRLIERGAIIENPTDFTNDEIKEIMQKTMTTDFMKRFIEEIRSRHEKDDNLKVLPVNISDKYFIRIDPLDYTWVYQCESNGIINLVRDTDGVLRIERFQVNPALRKKGIGFRLIYAALTSTGENQLRVHPVVDDDTLSQSEIEDIYRKLQSKLRNCEINFIID